MGAFCPCFLSDGLPSEFGMSSEVEILKNRESLKVRADEQHAVVC